MKKIFCFAATFTILTLSFTSCESLTTCKVCKQVTYVGGDFDHETSEAEYCDADLIAIEAMDDVIIGSSVTKWECH